MTDGPRDLPFETRAAPVNSVDADRRTVSVVWTAGAPVDRIDWMTGQRYVEELVISEKAVRLGILNSGGPVLDSHFRFGLASQLAVIERAWIEKGKGLADIRFPKADDDPEADKIFRKISDGIIRSLSCGYRRLKIEVDKSKDPVLWRVIDWEPFEISFVSVPADTQAQVRNADAAKSRCEFVTVGGGNAARLARMRIRNRMAGL